MPPRFPPIGIARDRFAGRDRTPSLMSRNVFVTGGAGFTGSKLVRTPHEYGWLREETGEGQLAGA